MPSENLVAEDEAPSIRALLDAGEVDRAYAEVVASTQDSLYRFLRHMLRDEDAAQDVFQDTYIRVFRALSGFRGEAALTTWVLTIGRNTALNRIRRQKTREGRTDSLDDAPLPPPEATVEPRDEVATRSLLDAVDTLPEAQREAVLLFYGEDMTLAEMAATTGRPENTLKSDLLRARKRLKRMLEDRTP